MFSKGTQHFLLVPSRNGFGHLRRMIAIGQELRSLGKKVALNIPGLDTEKVKLAKRANLDIVTIDMSGTIDGPYISSKELSQNYATHSLHEFEHVISDNLTEFFNVHPSCFLLAQFTWNDYYLQTSRNHPANEYETKLSARVDYSKFKRIFGMKYFTWPEISSNSNYQSIPLLDYWNLRSKRKTRSKEIVLVKSGIDTIRLGRIYEDFDSRFRLVKEIELENLPPLAVIIRPGLSSILETLAIGSVPVLLKDDGDVEMARNFETVISKGWGIEASKLELDSSYKIQLIEKFAMVPKEEFISPRDFLLEYLLPHT